VTSAEREQLLKWADRLDVAAHSPDGDFSIFDIAETISHEMREAVARLIPRKP
jgi:hypothetical protein